MQNKLGIIYGDLFYLNYYGVNVFMAVSDVGWERINVFELKTKIFDNKTKEYPELYKAQKDGYCLVVPNTIHNSSRELTLSVIPTEVQGKAFFWYNIDEQSQLYKTAVRINEQGVVKAGNVRFIKISDLPDYNLFYYKYNGGRVTAKEARENNKVERVWR